jgi:hypothetical protein
MAGAAILALVFFGGIGLGMILFARSRLRPIRTQRAWPTVNGTVLESSVVHEKQPLIGMVERAGSGYYPNIKYEYKVGDRSFTSTSFGWIQKGGLTHWEAQRIVDRHKQGQAAPVHYNPANPGETVLEPSRGGFIWIAMTIGGSVFALMGLALAGVALALS